MSSMSDEMEITTLSETKRMRIVKRITASVHQRVIMNKTITKTHTQTHKIQNTFGFQTPKTLIAI